MKRALIAVLCILFTTTLIFAQDASIYDDFRIPTYDYRTLQVRGNNLLDWYSHNDTDSHFNFGLGGDYYMMNQSPEFTWAVYDNLYFQNTSADNLNNGDAFTEIDEVLGGSVEKYFMGYFGPHAFADGVFDYYSHSEADDPVHDLTLNLGAGYGRITYAKPVAQAVAIAEELGGGLSNDKILKIADIIDSYSLYLARDKDDAYINYINDIAKVAGKPEGAMKIQQILSSAVYKMANRYVGWRARVSYMNRFMISPDLPAGVDDPKGMLVIRADYAKPMGLDRQLWAWFEYDNSLETDADPNMLIGFRATRDHNYLWSSYAQFEFNTWGTDPGNTYMDDTEMALSIGTTRVLYNRYTANAEFSYEKWDLDDDAEMRFMLNFGYWIW